MEDEVNLCNGLWLLERPASLGTRDGNMSVLLPNRILTLHKIH